MAETEKKGKATFDPTLPVFTTSQASEQETRQNLFGNAQQKVWYTSPGVLSEEECKSYRGELDKIFQSRSTKPGPTGRTVRDINNKVLRAQLWAKVKPHIPETFNGRSLLGPHPLMRVMRYQPEGFLSPHIDGTLKHGGQISFLTAFLYLNDDFLGGGTRFFREWGHCDETFPYEGEGVVDLIPSQGMINVFQHDLWHQGLPSNGVKYGIRMMIMYELAEGENFETAKVTHIWKPDHAR